jgi:hypothetical protein
MTNTPSSGNSDRGTGNATRNKPEGADDATSGARLRDPHDWKTGDEPMTAAQRSYLETLTREAGEDFDDEEALELTKAEAALRIEELQKKTGRVKP